MNVFFCSIDHVFLSSGREDVDVRTLGRGSYEMISLISEMICLP
jgi:tRNA U54 and U55 pseudouridine synthase Pus10